MTYLSLSLCNSVVSVDSKYVLIRHREHVLSENDDFQSINIRRSFLLKDAMRQLSKPSFNSNKVLRVVFIGEQAIDEGGPRREFFHLLLFNLFKFSGLFAGYPVNVTPLHNVQAVESKKFFTAGKMLCMSLIQGGEAPSCFTKAVADYLVYGEVRSPVDICDIHDETIRNSLAEVCTVNSNFFFIEYV